MAEAIHYVTYWYRYPQSLVKLANRVLAQRKISLVQKPTWC